MSVEDDEQYQRLTRIAIDLQRRVENLERVVSGSRRQVEKRARGILVDPDWAAR